MIRAHMETRAGPGRVGGRIAAGDPGRSESPVKCPGLCAVPGFRALLWRVLVLFEMREEGVAAIGAAEKPGFGQMRDQPLQRQIQRAP